MSGRLGFCIKKNGIEFGVECMVGNKQHSLNKIQKLPIKIEKMFVSKRESKRKLKVKEIALRCYAYKWVGYVCI